MSRTSGPKPAPLHVRDSDYVRLLAVRTGLRRFEKWSAERAAEQGVTPTQHQLLLAIRGHRAASGADPTVRDVAGYLLVRHHSAVELIDRTERGGLVLRTPDADDHRVVRLVVSPAGERILAALSGSHVEELARLTPLFESMLDTLSTVDASAAAVHPTITPTVP